MDDCGGGGGCFMSFGRPIVLGLGGGSGLEHEDAVGKMENTDMALVADKANENHSCWRKVQSQRQHQRLLGLRPWHQFRF